MEIPDSLLCVFSGTVEERGGSYVIEIPENEVSTGAIEAGDVYRVAMLSQVGSGEGTGDGASRETRSVPEPPVEEGDVREVEIEDIGQQGDGIARVDRGYVIIVPDTEIGDRVTVEITNVQENYAIGELVEDESDTDWV